MSKEQNSEEKTGYKSFDKYRGIQIFAEAINKGDKVTAEGALELMSRGFVKDKFHAKLYANSLMGDPQTTIANFGKGYEQLYAKPMEEVANQIHGKFLEKKLGDQYSEFQKDVKKHLGMTFDDLVKKYQRMTHLQEMVKDGSATDENKKEAEELAKDYQLLYFSIDAAEKSELKKIKNETGDISVDKTMESITEGYKQRAANNAKQATV